MDIHERIIYLHKLINSLEEDVCYFDAELESELDEEADYEFVKEELAEAKRRIREASEELAELIK